MNEIALVKKQVIKAEWAERIRQCRESGLTVSEWCRQNSINPKTYYYHLRKIRKEICEQIPVPVMTVAEESHKVKVSIGDMIAEIPEGISEQTITSVIRAMRNA
ncbi:MAG: IS66 family insertion sequence element accessory protein TnpA [Huintestinicola sp.]